MQYFTARPQAMALIYGNSKAPTIFGRVVFYQKNEHVLVVADIKRLPKNSSGFYGFHIHEGTACTGDGFSDSKSHYNPKHTPHPMHAGDLPPLLLCGNKAYFEVITDRFKVGDIIGKTVIIHSDPDDFITQPSGNAGVKIACGIIQKYK